MKAPLLHLLLLALVYLAIFTTATQVHADSAWSSEPGCIGADCNLMRGGALPLAHQHRKLLKKKIEGGSGFNDPGTGGLFDGDIHATIGSGAGSNAWNYLPARFGTWTRFAQFEAERSDEAKRSG